MKQPLVDLHDVDHERSVVTGDVEATWHRMVDCEIWVDDTLRELKQAQLALIVARAAHDEALRRKGGRNAR